MFEKIVLRNSQDGTAVSAGVLAEALLFYQNVHVVLNRGSLLSLLDKLGMNRLLALLSRGNVSAVYCEEQLCTITTQIGPFEKHAYGAVRFAGDEKVGVLRGRIERLEYDLVQRGHERTRARKLSQQFFAKVPLRKFSDDSFVAGGVIESARADFSDPAYVREAIDVALARGIGVPFAQEHFEFKILDGVDGFFIVTDIDFDAINARRSACNPPLDPITRAYLAGQILEARADTTLAAHYGGDFFTSEVSSAIVRVRYGELLRRMGIHSNELQEFKEIVLTESPSVREVIDSGERSFDEFLVLLEKSQRFRDWIQGVGPDEKLVGTYLRDVTAECWVNKLPGKSIRYMLTSTVGLVSNGLGLVLSAADSFLVEKLLGGWRPSHFVERRLKPFVGKTAD